MAELLGGVVVYGFGQNADTTANMADTFPVEDEFDAPMRTSAAVMFDNKEPKTL